MTPPWQEVTRKKARLPSELSSTAVGKHMSPVWSETEADTDAVYFTAVSPKTYGVH